MISYSLTAGTGVIRSDGVYIPEDINNVDWQTYQVWLHNGNTPTPYTAPSPVVTCALWQIEAVLTANQWANVLSFVVASNNANLIAFASHGSNLIPSNSVTLAQIAEAINVASNTLYGLVSNAANIVIP